MSLILLILSLLRQKLIACTAVVEPEEGHHHATAVCGLHETLYAKHFCMPAPPAQKQRLGSALASPQKSLTMWSDGIEMSSEVPSELGVGEEDLKVSGV